MLSFDINLRSTIRWTAGVDERNIVPVTDILKKPTHLSYDEEKLNAGLEFNLEKAEQEFDEEDKKKTESFQKAVLAAKKTKPFSKLNTEILQFACQAISGKNTYYTSMDAMLALLEESDEYKGLKEQQEEDGASMFKGKPNVKHWRDFTKHVKTCFNGLFYRKL